MGQTPGMTSESGGASGRLLVQRKKMLLNSEGGSALGAAVEAAPSYTLIKYCQLTIQEKYQMGGKKL